MLGRESTLGSELFDDLHAPTFRASAHPRLRRDTADELSTVSFPVDVRCQSVSPSKKKRLRTKSAIEARDVQHILASSQPGSTRRGKAKRTLKEKRARNVTTIGIPPGTNPSSSSPFRATPLRAHLNWPVPWGHHPPSHISRCASKTATATYICRIARAAIQEERIEQHTRELDMRREVMDLQKEHLKRLVLFLSRLPMPLSIALATTCILMNLHRRTIQL